MSILPRIFDNKFAMSSTVTLFPEAILKRPYFIFHLHERLIAVQTSNILIRSIS